MGQGYVDRFLIRLSTEAKVIEQNVLVGFFVVVEIDPVARDSVSVAKRQPKSSIPPKTQQSKRVKDLQNSGQGTYSPSYRTPAVGANGDSNEPERKTLTAIL